MRSTHTKGTNNLGRFVPQQRVSGQQQRVSPPDQQPLSLTTELQQPAGELLRSGPTETLSAAGSKHHSVQFDRLQSPDGPRAAVQLEPVVPQEEAADEDPDPAPRLCVGVGVSSSAARCLLLGGGAKAQ